MALASFVLTAGRTKLASPLSAWARGPPRPGRPRLGGQLDELLPPTTDHVLPSSRPSGGVTGGRRRCGRAASFSKAQSAPLTSWSNAGRRWHAAAASTGARRREGQRFRRHRLSGSWSGGGGKRTLADQQEDRRAALRRCFRISLTLAGFTGKRRAVVPIAPPPSRRDRGKQNWRAAGGGGSGACSADSGPAALRPAAGCDGWQASSGSNALAAPGPDRAGRCGFGGASRAAGAGAEMLMPSLLTDRLYDRAVLRAVIGVPSSGCWVTVVGFVPGGEPARWRRRRRRRDAVCVGGGPGSRRCSFTRRTFDRNDRDRHRGCRRGRQAAWGGPGSIVAERSAQADLSVGAAASPPRRRPAPRPAPPVTGPDQRQPARDEGRWAAGLIVVVDDSADAVPDLSAANWLPCGCAVCRCAPAAAGLLAPRLGHRCGRSPPSVWHPGPPG